MGAALGAMVGWMTYGSKKFEALDGVMRKNIAPLHYIMKDLIPMIDSDTNAFNSYMAAMKMPKKTEEEIAKRNEAMENGLKTAIQVPFTCMEKASSAWPYMIEIAKVGNIKSKSDMQVGARCLELGIWGCGQNVFINMKDIHDQEYIQSMTEKTNKMMEDAKKYSEEILEILEKREN